MQFEIHLDTWAELEQQIRELQGAQGMRLFESAGSASHLLFRGQANAEWELETTLDRTPSRRSSPCPTTTA